MELHLAVENWKIFLQYCHDNDHGYNTLVV
jgi:hypothetical protein